MPSDDDATTPPAKAVYLHGTAQQNRRFTVYTEAGTITGRLAHAGVMTGPADGTTGEERLKPLEAWTMTNAQGCS